MHKRICVQTHDFDLNAEYQAMRQLSATIGAICTFTGLVRDLNDNNHIQTLYLEHYPGMTERCLDDFVEQAHSNWPLNAVTVIHRVGELQVQDQIVLVMAASAHRGHAFNACEFIMDHLKTDAPFWKRESSNGQSRWLDARTVDQDAKKRW